VVLVLPGLSLNAAEGFGKDFEFEVSSARVAVSTYNSEQEKRDAAQTNIPDATGTLGNALNSTDAIHPQSVELRRRTAKPVEVISWLSTV
jgi:hypothetical protein